MFLSSFIHQALGLSPHNTDISFSRIWTDSRSVTGADLFAAIPGENFDGHAYVYQASQKGAKGAIVSNRDFVDRAKLPKDFILFEVPNTTEALRSIAMAYRKKLSIPFFAVAGSNGKTTTKEWIAFLLSQLRPGEIYKTAKSQNSILGIALSILQIRNEKFAVIEIGIDEPQWMDQHLAVVQPTHGLITTIAEEHLNRLKNIETIAEEELKLLKYLIAHKRSFAANVDSPWIRDHALPEDSLSYALEGPAEIEGLFESPQILNAFGIKWKNPLPGQHNAQNLLAALTAIRLLIPEISSNQLFLLSKEIHQFQNEAHRSHWIVGRNDVRIFDDCYNANPDSMEKSLQTFFDLADGCIQHLVIGDMLDLGDQSIRAHKRIMNVASVSSAEHIYFFGPEFKNILSNSPTKDPRVHAFESMDDLGQALLQKLKPAGCLFLKGSRGMKLERILDLLKSKNFIE